MLCNVLHCDQDRAEHISKQTGNMHIVMHIGTQQKAEVETPYKTTCLFNHLMIQWGFFSGGRNTNFSTGVVVLLLKSFLQEKNITNIDLPARDLWGRGAYTRSRSSLLDISIVCAYFQPLPWENQQQQQQQQQQQPQYRITNKLANWVAKKLISLPNSTFATDLHDGFGLAQTTGTQTWIPRKTYRLIVVNAINK